MPPQEHRLCSGCAGRIVKCCQLAARGSFPCMGIMQYNKSSTERAKEDIKAALNQLNTHLLTKTFLVGERISLADIAVCCTMINLFKLVLDPAFRKSYVNVTR